tara:strand:- start:5249 stop:5680 length:432 start_codon:yes stop_codon:yes gene_type:complete
MFSRLFQTTYNKLSFEDIQFAIIHSDQFILINTLMTTDQSCLIRGTVPYNKEEELINKLISSGNNTAKKVIIYGKHGLDESTTTKYNQLQTLGFQSVYIYVGGLFEWLLLQDIYGKDEFPTTSPLLDILKHKPPRTFGGNLLT